MLGKINGLYERMKLWIYSKLFPNKVYYINGTDALPPPLAQDVEDEMISNISEPYAKDMLIEHNLRLVAYIAKRFENTGANSACWYGGFVYGLDVTADTRYTYDWKVKSNNQNSGLTFAAPASDLISNGYNIYGKFSTGNICTEYSSNKIVNVNTPGKDYVAVSDMAVDADGYASMRVEMYGYKATVYYLNTAGEWVNYNEFDMRETQKFDGSATYIAPYGLQLCVGFYVYNKNMSAEYKDINIYKGLLITDPEGKLDPVIEEPEVPTTGDSAVVFAIIAVIALCGTAVVVKRREN
jgi:hypothetical protein